MLNEIPGVVCPMPDGAFYAYPSLKGLLSDTHPTTLDLASYVLDEAKVAFVPGEAFGSPGFARFSYALGDDAIVEGITRMQKLFG